MPKPEKLRIIINYLLMLMLLTSCNEKTSTQNMLEEAQNVYSWAATADMVGDAWVRGAVPSNYAQQTLKKAQEELLKESGKIVKMKLSTDATGRYKSVLLAETLQLASITEQISIAVAQKNRTAMHQQLTELVTEARSLNKLRTILRQTDEKNI